MSGRRERRPTDRPFVCGRTRKAPAAGELAGRGLLRRARVLIVEVGEVDLDRRCARGAVKPRRSSALASSSGERSTCSCATVCGAIRCMPESRRSTPSSPSFWTMVVVGVRPSIASFAVEDEYDSSVSDGLLASTGVATMHSKRKERRLKRAIRCIESGEAVQIWEQRPLGVTQDWFPSISHVCLQIW